MIDEIKKALKICIESAGCESCKFMDDPDCSVDILIESLKVIEDLEKALARFSKLNAKLNEELQNSIDLKKYMEEKDAAD